MNAKTELKIVPQSKRTMIRRAQNIRDQIYQFFDDVEHWNKNVRKQHEELINPDPKGKLKAILNGINAMLEKEGVKKSS